MAKTRCRHCASWIKPCNCGAGNGRPHWVDYRDERYCPRQATRLHEPTTDTEEAAK